jgi:hypothetical protein
MSTSAGAVALSLLVLTVPVVAHAKEQRESREHPDLAARLSTLRTVGIVTPDVKMYELTASNQSVLRPDWSERGIQLVTSSVEAALREHGVAARRFTPSTAADQEQLSEVVRLYRQVVAAVFEATFVANFPAKVARFEYSVGDLGTLLDSQQLDGLVFTFGSGTASSGGRKALQAVSAVFAGVASSGVDRLVVGVVDRRGDLLWFGVFASTAYDLRESDSAEEFVRALAHDLPVVKR